MAFPSAQQLQQILEEVVDTYGLDIEGIKISRAGKKSTVAIAVDGDNRPGSEVMEALSNEVSALFDAKEESGELNFGPGYTLEITTPGVGHPLTLPRHWHRNRGRLVVFHHDGVKHTGRIGALSANDDEVVIISRSKEGLKRTVWSLEQVAGAAVEVEFSAPAADEVDLANLPFDSDATDVKGTP